MSTDISPIAPTDELSLGEHLDRPSPPIAAASPANAEEVVVLSAAGTGAPVAWRERLAVHADRMTYRNPGAQPVYAPNSYGGPQADPAKALPSWWVEAAEIGRYAYEAHRDDDDFIQPGTLYRDVMTPTDRDHLVTNIVAHASAGVTPEVQRRVIEYWTNVDADLGSRVATGLGYGAAIQAA
ncbi:MAG: catalase-related domain-containing protein [Solirubrobacteraceae bacterium]